MPRLMHMNVRRAINGLLRPCGYQVVKTFGARNAWCLHPGQSLDDQAIANQVAADRKHVWIVAAQIRLHLAHRLARPSVGLAAGAVGQRLRPARAGGRPVANFEPSGGRHSFAASALSGVATDGRLHQEVPSDPHSADAEYFRLRDQRRTTIWSTRPSRFQWPTSTNGFFD